MDSQKRSMLALGLVLVMTTVYMMFFAPHPPPVPPGQTEGSAAPPSNQAQAPTPTAAAHAPSIEPASMDAPPARVISVDRDVVHYRLSSQGAGLLTAELQGQKMTEQPKLTLEQGIKRLFGDRGPRARQMEMAQPMAGQPLPLAIAIRGVTGIPEGARYAVEEKNGEVFFTTRQGSLEVTKRFTWLPSGLEFSMAVAVRNLGAERVSGEMVVYYPRGIEPGSEEKGSLFGGIGNESQATCAIADDVHRLGPGGKPPSDTKGPISFFGVNQQYFLAAVFPLDGPQEGKCELSAPADGRAVSAAFPLEVAGGQTVERRFGIYVGPKSLEMLKTVPERMKALGLRGDAISESSWSARMEGVAYPHLEKTVDFGIWAVICKVLLWILKGFHGVVHNWGVAIILLTVVVKVVLIPLTHKSMVSGEAMKKLQPRVEEIRKKFRDDKERQNIETMKLYQEAKVNPLGGCLPMLFQLPIWAALFTTLRNSYEIYREPFLAPLWMDLTYKDPAYIFPLALGITQIVTQKLQPQTMDAAQAKVMTYLMPIFFTAIMVNYPAGLTLYIFTNNLLTIAQQYGLKKWMERGADKNPAEKPGRIDHARQPAAKRSGT